MIALLELFVHAAGGGGGGLVSSCAEMCVWTFGQDDLFDHVDGFGHDSLLDCDEDDTAPPL